ncbi:MAG: hypothetical protein MI974_04255 [Chitinophagales bacterium]|nr:hypothetical protein [Chitinophagales bacterium]
MALPSSKIEHVIYYMLENRSFDNVLGWLYDEENPPKHIISNPSQKDTPFMGLKENTYFNKFKWSRKKHYVTRGTGREDVPLPDPNEEFENVNVQLFYPKWCKPTISKTPDRKMEPTMGGFLKDYKTARKHAKFGFRNSRKKALQILQTYDKTELNILNTLAEEFAVSDYWFSSVPTQTNSNRAFSVSGASDGFVNNEGFLFGIVPDKFKGHTIWQELYDKGFKTTEDWMIYYQDLLPVKNADGKIELKGFSYTEDAFNIPNPEKTTDEATRPNPHIAHIDALFDILEGKPGAGTLPTFSYLEPLWVGLFEVAGIVKDTNIPNSYHPPGEVAPGEAFVKRLYEALRANKELWEKTLLIITFDEHGGIYDHIPPPHNAAVPGLPEQPLPKNQPKFDFDRFGVRVPTIMISPWIEKGTVFRSLTDDPNAEIRTPYDHTSMIKTILNWDKFGISVDEKKFGARVANAPSFESVLNVQGDKPRTDTPETLPEPFFKVNDKRAIYFSHLQALVLPIIVKIINALSHKEAKKKAKEILKRAKTVHDLHEEIAKLSK